MIGDGIDAARLAFGAAPLGNLFAEIAEADAAAALARARSVGIRLVDTAPLYGHGLSEERVGRHGGGLPLCTKVGRRLEPCAPGETPDHGFVRPNSARPVFDYTRDGVRRQVDASLARLRAERLDTLLLHDVGARTHGQDAPAVLRLALDEALPALAELKAAGVVAHVGLGVNEWEVCEDVLAHAELDRVLLAGRYTLLEQGALGFLDRARRRGVAVMAAGVFNSGMLAGSATHDYAPAPPALLERRDRLAAVCARHGVPLAVAAIRFPLLHPAVALAVVGMRSAAEVDAAVAALATPVPGALWDELKADGMIRADAPC